MANQLVHRAKLAMQTKRHAITLATKGKCVTQLWGAAVITFRFYYMPNGRVVEKLQSVEGVANA